MSRLIITDLPVYHRVSTSAKTIQYYTIHTDSYGILLI
jgi:hypothetical protein